MGLIEETTFIIPVLFFNVNIAVNIFRNKLRRSTLGHYLKKTMIFEW